VNLTFTILGCGSSGGVPRVGQGWGACDRNNPKNRRRRCSIFVERSGESGATQVLVDMSPDLREQLLGLGIGRLDAILLTHSHADHIHGSAKNRPVYGRRHLGHRAREFRLYFRNAPRQPLSCITK
jgi:phosphoribosyl 1,2-cyclic phosphate phosphodiesterase